MRSRSLFIAMCACLTLVSACSTPQPRHYQQNLLIRCPETLPTLNDGTGGTILETMKLWAEQYHGCAIPHNGLVDAIRAAE